MSILHLVKPGSQSSSPVQHRSYRHRLAIYVNPDWEDPTGGFVDEMMAAVQAYILEQRLPCSATLTWHDEAQVLEVACNNANQALRSLFPLLRTYPMFACNREKHCGPYVTLSEAGADPYDEGVVIDMYWYWLVSGGLDEVAKEFSRSRRSLA